MKVVYTREHPRNIDADVVVQPFVAPLEGGGPLARHLSKHAPSFIVPDRHCLTWLEPRRFTAPRLVMASVGSEDELQPSIGWNGAAFGPMARAVVQEGLRVAGSVIERGCFDNDVGHLALAAAPGIDPAPLVEGILLRAHAPMEFRRRDIATTVDTLTVCVPDERIQARVVERVVLARARNTARTLSDLPGNVGHPAGLEERIQKVASGAGLEMETLDRVRLDELGMGLFLGVGAGGAHEPRLLVLQHRPGGRRPTLVLLGKGVTHDTGGYNLKTDGDMHELTYDKAGAMAVVGAMEAIAKLKVDANVVALVPLVENCVDAHAYKPGDILTAMDKTTVYVENTDAEGRLVLADCLTYARRFRPRLVIDIGTLTLGCSTALGSPFAGLYSNDDAGRELAVAAGLEGGDQVWPMPIHRDHRGDLQHHKAQLCNTGPVAGQPSHAAAFLAHFSRFPWAHIDMAGKGHSLMGRGACGRGATGFGVGLLVRAAQAFAEGHPASRPRRKA